MPKRNWVQSSGSFRRLLAWLDEGADSGGERYLEIRRRLVAYFDRKSCSPSDDLADETLNRVARRLDEEGAITDIQPARYCYVVAKFVFLEHLRSAEHGHKSLDFEPPSSFEPIDIDERMLDGLDRCLQKLDAADRGLILDYYSGDQATKIGNRRKLAARLGMTANALSIRACRIRARLETCVSGTVTQK